ncbi:MAG: hypothetical protein A3C85_04195 [Candidatus Doudnabacteria bacterium RIFCSPHIGHO2_02_FULL_48_21]|uniref:Dihydrofolate reductase n=1 Tax=Candidatus Doudnabacteria bacterium RIFCSPLOWO2_02_FULL_48_13 TaxID=1817845 RepID=A0A1F5QB32_9BACT|nr:MAG: hypothetical protein A3K05_00880 [Candidatus Doudnabacteria bacterium RIFCSPHIGHO2_01_48_18]OGE78863.1 MAG: hypothetical protein A2668_00595 [Candidatus Doudnabacteria bacterium RIFCSPHIGHO2_01_FULL_48_180]OGE91854.1 MAG: hypothetical protein A3F44_04275 [Candidatus Doudnabacteria bacterium RIFCSPHIGHO2_12_FULL_47_25]OGE94091.1 MAG: hypothetical protein A3C85_04195 [Candidatus Doudnabacteria bacterium RIFCSPHIGHO2_02_FULL_48_21]OGE98203.1 MAG: hypothetical protein A3A83_03480 [Candidatu
MPIILIAAVDKNFVIGKENDLPWYLPEDLKRFKALTTGKTVLMGRKTFESIMSRNGKPLPKRKNVVITSNKDCKVPGGVLVFNDLGSALAELKSDDIFVIGGGQIFAQTIDQANALYITHVEMDSGGDVFFPLIDSAIWNKVEEEPHEGFTFAKYEKIR